MGRPSRFSPEVRERAVRLVMEQRPAHPSEWAALQAVATKLGTTGETLRNTGQRPGLTTSERERLAVLERENRELKRTNEILKTASAFFAQAALDRRTK
jgi:transposase